MSHTQVYKCYKSWLPDHAARTKEYFPNGKDSIRIREVGGQEFIFTVLGEMSWKWETIAHFIKDLKGEKKHG